MRFTNRLLKLVVLFTMCAATAHAADKPARIAVLDFGATDIGVRVAEKLAQAVRSLPNDLQLVDRDQTRAAALGSGYRGSLNLTVEDARDLGAAIDCDFFMITDAQTLRRSSSETPVYFESYAMIYLVSARTGKLVEWQVTVASPKYAQPAPSEQELLQNLGPPAVIGDYFKRIIKKALETESTQRALAIESGAPVIEVMSDNDPESTGGTRPPRPYRRLKPDYPAWAAKFGIEATVDVLVDVDKAGEVGQVEIARWAGYGLDESVMKTVKQLHFFPALRNGVAIPMRVLLRYNFRKPPLPTRTSFL
jgi:TonB family protein